MSDCPSSSVSATKASVSKILLFLIFLNEIYLPVAKEVDFKNTANDLLVSHYDCNLMSKNRIYSLNDVEQCNIQLNNVQEERANVKLYQRTYFSEVNATMCRVKHQRQKWYCGSHDHSSIDAKQASITTNLLITPKMCKIAMQTGMIPVEVDSEIINIPIYHNIEKLSYYNLGKVSTTNRNECHGRSWITHHSFASYMQKTSLRTDLESGTVLNALGQQLPCHLSDNGCDSSSLDPFGYTWENIKNCQLKLIRIDVAVMIKHSGRYFIQQELNNNYLLEILLSKTTVCDPLTEYFQTNYKDMFILYDGGFDMSTGQKKIYTPPKRIPYKDQAELENVSRLAKHIIRYDTQIGSKLDYLLFQGYERDNVVRVEMLKRICEIERTQLLIALKTSLENSRMAGYILTGNRSLFLETSGSIAHLFFCPKKYSPLQIQTDKCFYRIPIIYINQILFVDTITRKTFSYANEQDCNNENINFFQLDLENPTSWFTLTPTPTYKAPPLMFSPKTKFSELQEKFDMSTSAGIYSQNQIDSFWKQVLLNSASKDALQKFSREIIEPSLSAEHGTFGSTYQYPNKIYVDNLISPDFFRNQFKGLLGNFYYYLSICGHWTSIIGFIIALICAIKCIFRFFELRHLLNGFLNVQTLILHAF